MSLSADTVAINGASALRRLGDFFELTKPRVVLMVLVTAFVRSTRRSPRRVLHRNKCACAPNTGLSTPIGISP